jgi:hypothetical protein
MDGSTQQPVVSWVANLYGKQCILKQWQPRWLFRINHRSSRLSNCEFSKCEKKKEKKKKNFNYNASVDLISGSLDHRNSWVIGLTVRSPFFSLLCRRKTQVYAATFQKIQAQRSHIQFPCQSDHRRLPPLNYCSCC